ncbi:MAG TPA: pyridoxamine 5'-phosphate oxidase family protein [Pseudonocardiaceae bacterium]|nr:pyridoxamine 5'-phosphate oxidase family protein [Pseudonocardiaceae bacterium]
MRRLAAADHGLVVLATTRKDNSVHASVVNAGVLDDPVSGVPSVGMVIRGDARKLEHLRRNGRATVVFRAGWEWVSVEGAVRVIGQDDPAEGFAAEGLPQLLRDIFIAAGGTHDDFDTYDRVMAEEHRVAVFIAATKILGN